MAGKSLDVDDGRHFRNEWSDKDPALLESKFSDVSSFNNKLQSTVQMLLQNLEKHVESMTDRHDSSVYTGTSGIALMYLHLSSRLGSEQQRSCLQKALAWLERGHVKSSRRSSRVTFLCGDAGTLAIGAVLYNKVGNAAKSKEYLDQLLQQRGHVNDLQSGLPDEYLYGRAGYLYALHYVRDQLGTSAVPEQYLDELRDTMLRSGVELARQERSPCPLMYEWHGSYYLGAAHGLCGIFYLLMQSGRADDLVKQGVDYMLSLQWPSGNCPSSLGSERDKLVHWCHGAPGWIYMFVKAYQVYQDVRYLDAAHRCADSIWTRGLLTKGYGLCHGTAGNGYAFLLMYRLTGEQQYLHRAYEFADWCCEYGNHGCRIADRPYSMFEGMAGTIYYLADLLDPTKARFPAFEVD